MRHIDFKLLQALDTVIALQSFEKAANQLAITQSAVSQRIKQLEQQLAQPVLIRTLPLRATETGVLLLRYFRQVSQLELSLQQQLFPHQPHKLTSVSVAVNADSLASWFMPAVLPLLTDFKMTLNLQVTNEQNTQVLLNRGEVFAALSSQQQSFSGCKTQYLGSLDYLLCASPSFKQQFFANGVHVEALQQAPGVLFDQDDTMHTDYIEQHFGLKKGDYPLHILASSEAFVAIALAGAAYCLLPKTQAQTYIQSGELVNLMPNEPLVQHLYWHSWVLEQGVHKQLSQTVVEYGRALLAKINE